MPKLKCERWVRADKILQVEARRDQDETEIRTLVEEQVVEA